MLFIEPDGERVKPFQITVRTADSVTQHFAIARSTTAATEAIEASLGDEPYGLTVTYIGAPR